MTYLLALDQGTSSSRSIMFRPDGSILASGRNMMLRELEVP